MAIPVKSSGPISFSEIKAGVISAGGTSSTSFANLSRQAYSITGNSRFLTPDNFTDFEYTTTTTTSTTTTTTTTAAPTTTTTTTTTTCLPYGTLISTYCIDVDLFGVYANGSCGTFNQIIETNSTSCGYTTTTTTTTYPTVTITYTAQLIAGFVRIRVTNVSGGNGGPYDLSFDNGGSWTSYSGGTQDFYPFDCGVDILMKAKDSIGNQSTTYTINVACPTTTTTTTTTTVFPGYFYNAEQYDCGTCTYQGDYIVKSDVPLSSLSYYSTDGSFSYRIMGGTSPQSYICLLYTSDAADE